MNKTISKIRAGLRDLSNNAPEIISGTVVPGSLSESNGTVSVLPSGNSQPIEGVMLSQVTGEPSGLLLFPTDGSSVTIGSINGPGIWTVLKTSEIDKALIKIANVTAEISADNVKIQNSEVIFNIDSSLFKMSTATESLYKILNDCFTYIQAITVTASGSVSSTPANIADFINLQTRLNNLLTS